MMEFITELLQYMSDNSAELIALTVEHIVMVLQAMGLALLVGVPLGILAAKVERLAPVILSLVNILQLIPSLAMLAILLIYFGLGNETVVIGLFFYSLLPIVRNTYVGIKEVDPGVSEAGIGIGMTPFQLLAKVQFPLSIPFLMAGYAWPLSLPLRSQRLPRISVVVVSVKRLSVGLMDKMIFA